MPSSRSYYSNTIERFLDDDEPYILGELTRNHSHNLENLQRNAWVSQIQILKDCFSGGHEGSVFFEFAIPRMGKRVDNIVIIGDLIFVIEFKVGADGYEKHAVEQVLDYSLDLKNFHEGSHDKKIIPVLASTQAVEVENDLKKDQDSLYKTIFANANNLFPVLNSCLSERGAIDIDIHEWEESVYKPTPTIIEAAQALYRGHDVKEISRSDSGAINLTKTTDCLNNIIDHSKQNSRKSICFVTGVPGAGKTLAGLNVANTRMNMAEDENAVFLSGNAPLVEVLREALTRDKVSTEKELGNKVTKKDAERESHSFIQNVHHFRDDGLESDNPPAEKVVIFDEAQRAWTQKQVSAFMKIKKGVLDFSYSEPHFLIDVMNRHNEWCSIICLVGGGQEINTGEAGLEEWVRSLKDNFPEWDVYFSDLVISDSNYLEDSEIKDWLIENGEQKQELHLGVSVRSFRSEKLSFFIHELLDLKTESAEDIYETLKDDYPIRITRDHDLAKHWIKKQARGSERFGVIASSNARRLKAVGINVKNGINVSNWFLDGKEDVRSSYYMEDIATEFDIQGLELDWTVVCWGADLFYKDDEWNYQAFKGTKWQNINQEIKRRYLLNTYRVLLTRARQGFVIYIPEGSDEDSTRMKEFYDGTYEYLTKKLKIDELA
jgi:DUF2075 family protein